MHTSMHAWMHAHGYIIMRICACMCRCRQRLERQHSVEDVQTWVDKNTELSDRYFGVMTAEVIFYT